MSKTSREKKNYIFLYRGLLIVRDSLLQFVKDCLQKAYGDEAWQRGVERVFRPEDIEKLKAQFNKRYASPAGPIRSGKELYEILDINYFVNIIEGNWKQAFASPLNNDRTLLAYIQEIVLYRNPVAHPETEDLRDDDTFRGLDTGERTLRLIDKSTANEIIKIKNEFRQTWILEEIRLQNLSPEEVGINFTVGFKLLEEAIKELTPRDSEEHRDFSAFKKQVISCLRSERKGVFTPEVKALKENSLRELDKLAIQLLGKPFIDTCVTETLLEKLNPQEAAQKTHSLKREIKELEGEISNLGMRQAWQASTGAPNPYIDRQVNEKKVLLDERRREYKQLWDEVSPSSFFTIERIVCVDNDITEEQPFDVRVEISNLGRDAAETNYEEGLSDTIIPIDGQLTYKGELAPEEKRILIYRCYCKEPGRHLLFTKRLDYPGRVQGWDQLGDTTVRCNVGNGPDLVGTRHYQFVQNGIELIMRLHNRGDKIAHGVTVQEQVSLRKKRPEALEFTGDIFPDEDKTISCILKAASIEELKPPQSTMVSYFDNKSKSIILRINEPYVLLEYIFPSNIQIVGRHNELKRLEQIIEQAQGGFSDPYSAHVKKLILIEGIEGIGKTKLVQELVKLAHTYRFRCFVEDATGRSPIKRMLRQLLGLSSDDDRQGSIWSSLEAVPGIDEVLAHRGLISRFITREYEPFDSSDVARIKADFLVLIRTLCRHQLTLLIFENVQRIPEGIERDLFQLLLSNTVLNKDIPLYVCATYRPEGVNPPRAIQGSDIQSVNYEKLRLDSLSQEECKYLVDSFITFPKLCKELQDIAYKWSKGNPFYLVDFIRYLARPSAGLLRRIGNEWYPSSGFKLDKYPEYKAGEIPPESAALILERVKSKEELGAELKVLRILSVIGLDLPWPLVSAMLSQEYPTWTEQDILRQLTNLERAGFVRRVDLDKTGEFADSQGEFNLYEFDHQIKREVIYNDPEFPSEDKMYIRGKIVENLLSKKIFRDEEEYIRQLARHLLYTSRRVQVQNREYFIRAARIEEKLWNFPRSLEYYNAFLSIAEGAENYTELSRALLQRARIHVMKGSWDQARQDLFRALESLKSAEETREAKSEIKSLRIRIHKEYGSVLLKQNRLEEANKLLYKARIQYEGSLRQRRFFSPKSLQFYEDLVEIYLMLSEVWSKGLDYTAGGGAIFGLPNSKIAYGRAKYYAEKAFKTFQDPSLLVKVYISLGELSNSAGEYDQAINWLQQAVNIINQQPESRRDLYSEERAFTQLAEVYRARELKTNARDCYNQAREIQEKLQDYIGLAVTYGGIGDLYIEEDNFEEAQYYLEQAYQYQQSVGDLDRFWRTCFSLTKIYIKNNQFDNANRYWSDAKTVVVGRFDKLPDKKRVEIISVQRKLSDYFRSKADWKKSIEFQKDLCSMVSNDNSLLADSTLSLGEMYYRVNDLDNALDVLLDGLHLTDDTLTRAEYYDHLGDVYSAIKDEGAAIDQYDNAVNLLIREKSNKQALDIYDKLLREVSKKRSGLPHITAAFLRLFEAMVSKGSVDIRFIERSEKTLLEHKLHRDAGDILVYATRMMAPLEESLVSLDKKLSYLHQAKELYESTKKNDDIIWGMNVLIPTYFRLGAWDNIAQCFEELLNACIKARKPDEFVPTFRNLTMMYDKLNTNSLKALNALAIETISKEKLEFTHEQKTDVMLNIAKKFHRISGRVGKEEQEEYEDFALNFYKTVTNETDNDHVVGVVLNDTALIYQRRKDFKEARKRLEKSIQVAHNTEDKFSLGCRYVNLARLQTEMGDFSKAEYEFERGIAALWQMNSYWDERIRNKDKEILTADDVARIRFDKIWLASTSFDFGQFIFNKDQNKSLALLHKALETYGELGDIQNVEMVEKTISLIREISGASQFLPIGDWEPVHIEYWICPNCEKVYLKDEVQCPYCGSRFCPRCSQPVDDQDEYCPICERYIGKTVLKHTSQL